MARTSRVQNHHKLDVYHAALELASQVYNVVDQLPPAERFVLAHQLRRAAISVGSNIVEGCGRSTHRDLLTFLGFSLGSANEVEFQLQVVKRQALAPAAEVDPALDTATRVQQMLTRLMMQIRKRNPGR